MPNLTGSFLPIIVVLVFFAIVAGVVKILLAGGARSQGYPYEKENASNTEKEGIR